MSIQFQNFIRSGFLNAAHVFSTSDEPMLMEFNGKTAKVVNGVLRSSREMKNAGVATNFDETCVLLKEEFEELGAGFESEITINGRKLRIKDIEHAAPLVILMLAAPR